MIFSKEKGYILLKLSVVFVFLGRAYQHIFWDAPLRTFFWDEHLLKPFIEAILNTSWQAYVTSLKTDFYIDTLGQTLGFLYLICAIIVVFSTKLLKFLKQVVIIGGVGLIVLAFLLMKTKFYQFGQFFEYSLQFGLPFVFVYYNKAFVVNNLNLILKILIAAVFISHGLYAVGYYPVPGYFLGMVIDILGFSEEGARLFLLIAGILDFVVSVLIFIPRTAKYALIYAFIWGLLTSFARVVAGFSFDYFLGSLHLNLYQVIYRLPHALIPLMLVYNLKGTIENVKED